MRKANLVLAVFLIFCIGLCGCSQPVQKEPEHNTAYSLSAAEYQMAVNHKIAPLISNLQSIANEDVIDEELGGQILKHIDEVYQGIADLNPPKAKALYQAELLDNLSLAQKCVEYQSGKSDDQPTKSLNEILPMIEAAFRVSVN